MTALLTVLGSVVGSVGIAALLASLFGNSQYEQGQLEERNAEQQAADAAKDRANAVLNDGRSVDDSGGKLRDGTF